MDKQTFFASNCVQSHFPFHVMQESPAEIRSTKPPRKKGTKRLFTQAEDALLVQLVQNCGCCQWKKIAKMFPNRSTRQCRERYCHYLNPKLNNNPWTPEEDALLIQKYNEIGPRWAIICQFFDNRTDINVKNHYWTIMAHQKGKKYVSESNIKEASADVAHKNNDKEDEKIGEDVFGDLINILWETHNNDDDIRSKNRNHDPENLFPCVQTIW